MSTFSPNDPIETLTEDTQNRFSWGLGALRENCQWGVFGRVLRVISLKAAGQPSLHLVQHGHTCAWYSGSELRPGRVSQPEPPAVSVQKFWEILKERAVDFLKAHPEIKVSFRTPLVASKDQELARAQLLLQHGALQTCIELLYPTNGFRIPTARVFDANLTGTLEEAKETLQNLQHLMKCTEELQFPGEILVYDSQLPNI